MTFNAFNAAGYGFAFGQPGDGTLAQIGYSNPIVSAAITQVSSAGRTLYDSTGALNTNPATRLYAAPFSPFTGGDSASSASALPQLITVGGGVTRVTVASEGSTAGPASLSFLKGPYSAQASWSASTGVAQSAAFSPAAVRSPSPAIPPQR